MSQCTPIHTNNKKGRKGGREGGRKKEKKEKERKKEKHFFEFLIISSHPFSSIFLEILSLRF
jgi:hypothetical protein